MRAKRFLNLAGAPPAVRNGRKSKLPIKLSNNADGAEIHLYETIGEDFYGDGVSAMTVKEFLRDNQGRPVSVRINSFGGDVYDGVTIYNSLLSHTGRVTVTIDGIAFSAASFIAMAGDHVRMYPTSDIGIHRASVITWGNQREHQSAIDWLNTIDEHLIDIYQDRTGRKRNEIEKWLDGVSDGTVFPATEAKRLGFVDEVIDTGRAGNRGNSRSRSSSTQAARNRLKMAGLRAKQKSGKRSQQTTTPSARRRLEEIKRRIERR
ncbi:head maturation protease, ClpP-related [Stieleria mannarensis]|uniref:head maturation protease, ClpP-related n=1 Tax=Stieleria mannarensis TaxID=2755585 RepID=UPI0016040CB1|nr:head maturation protease, ClpP-related [Rhodopirellula sp. JC639]